MAINYPNKFPVLTDEEFSVERPVSIQTARKLMQALNMLGALTPIGEMKAFNLNQANLRAPSASQFQYCDGQEITDVSSPLTGVGAGHNFTPNMQGRYLRGATASTTSGNEAGGAASVDVSHNHGGTTGSNNPGYTGDGENDPSEQASGKDHSHGINTDLPTSQALELAHIAVTFFLKIN